MVGVVPELLDFARPIKVPAAAPAPCTSPSLQKRHPRVQLEPEHKPVVDDGQDVALKKMNTVPAGSDTPFVAPLTG